MNKKNSLQLLYNIIKFDFILLEASTNKISNFFLEKIKVKKNNIYRLALLDVVKMFKTFINLNMFIKKIKKLKLNTIYFWIDSEYLAEFFIYFFKKYKLHCKLYISLFLPNISNALLNSIITLDQIITKKEFFILFYKRVNIIQTMSLLENFNFFTYKFFINLCDYKKLSFISLILYSIYKK